MNISVQKLLAKIDDELRLAKGSTKEENLREKIYSIKILCELILDEKQAINEVPIVRPANTIIEQQPFQPTFSLNQPKKLELNEEANGDSLFDF